jgi:hypothetical protein
VVLGPDAELQEMRVCRVPGSRVGAHPPAEALVELGDRRGRRPIVFGRPSSSPGRLRLEERKQVRRVRPAAALGSGQRQLVVNPPHKGVDNLLAAAIREVPPRPRVEVAVGDHLLDRLARAPSPSSSFIGRFYGRFGRQLVACEG